MEECLKLSVIDNLFNEAVSLQGKVTAGEATEEEQTRVTDLVRRMDEDWGRELSPMTFYSGTQGNATMINFLNY